MNIRYTLPEAERAVMDVLWKQTNDIRTEHITCLQRNLPI